MALKFLNKKGWHTGSLRNIENVWKAEQKQAAEEKKLEELRKQIHEERERSEFRQLQEQAGLIPKVERLDFLYESGLAVGKGSSSFKALESLPKNDPGTSVPSSSNSNAATAQQVEVPGALFQEKPQSANESWRKLHSDPLLLIRQKEMEALARVKNNPIQMAMIKKSVEAKKKHDEKKHDEKKHRKKHHKKSKDRAHSSKNDSDSEDAAFKGKMMSNSHHKHQKSGKSSYKEAQSSDEESTEMSRRTKRYYDKEYKKIPSGETQGPKYDINDVEHKRRKRDSESQNENYSSESRGRTQYDKQSHFSSSQKPHRREFNNRRHQPAVKLTEEQRAAKLLEMQMEAERCEEQRWKRIKTTADRDAAEAIRDNTSSGRNFLDATQKSIYGTEKGGSVTIEESVRRRTHYSQGRSDSEKNAFRR